MEEKRRPEQFLNITNLIISFESIKTYIKEISRYAKRRDYANSVCRFLEFIAKKKCCNVRPFIGLLKGVKPPEKERKLFADDEDDVYLLTLEEIQGSIKVIVGSCKPITALRAITLIAFIATTGVRPEEACAKKVSGIYTPGIQKTMFDLDKDYIILPTELSKTGYQFIPI